MFSSIVFALSTFLSATLLFVFESIVGKQILPLAGGGALVWNTCLVFFQIVLLAGYGLAFFLSRVRSLILQVSVVSGLLLLAVTGSWYLQNGVIGAPVQGADPQGWLWLWLTGQVALPFLSIATLSPLLQHWYGLRYKSASPYVLYAVGNAGNAIGLLAYPLWIERVFSLSDQRSLVLLGLSLILTSVSVAGLSTVLLLRREGLRPKSAETSPQLIGLRQKLWWLLLSAVPSSLLLSITSYILTDIAAIPLFWIIPLLVYLLTFVLAFSALDGLPLKRIGRATAFLTLPLCLSFLVDANGPAIVLIPLHLLNFGLAGLFCHGLLVANRPRDGHNLTLFYLYVGLGGAIGGLFTLLVCPLLWARQLELPLALVVVCLLRSVHLRSEVSASGFKKAALILALSGGSYLLVSRFLPAEHDSLVIALTYLPAAILVLNEIRHPGNYSLALSAVILACLLIPTQLGRVIRAERNFYGLVRVTARDNAHYVIHGSTIHGAERLQEGPACNPLMYFHPSGPAGVIPKLLPSHDAKVAVVGLGVGALACYARPEDAWTFLELNPAMERVARDESLFTFLRNSKAGQLKVKIGDGRLLLASQTELFDLIIMDAFSSDSIPTHLLTREAMEVYLSKLRPGGRMLFHISNRFFDLAPQIQALAESYALTVRINNDLLISTEDAAAGKTPSTWVIISPADNLDLLDGHWTELPIAEALPRPWSDDFSDLLAAMKIQTGS